MIPVVVGGDIGAYALIRAFYEYSGVRGVVVAKVHTRVFAHTKLAEVRVADVDTADALVAALLEVARDKAGQRLVLLSNADWYVEAIINARGVLEEFYEIPMCSAAAFARVSSKSAFHEDCDALGIPVPRQVAVDVAVAKPEHDDALLASLTYPVIGKPSSSAEYYYVDFPGKRKIHHLDSRDQVDTLLGALRGAGYRGTFLLQEFIPGDETQMRSLTAYRDSRGVVTLMCTGRVLLEEHTPGTLGIPAAILTEPYADAMDAMAAYLERVDYRGFANADYKRDERTGRHVFFEVNPRIGRNNYYVTAAGANVARFVEADLDSRDIEPMRVMAQVLYSVVPIALLRRYLLDRALRKRVMAAARRSVARPLLAPGDRSPRRIATVLALTANYWRKYRAFYPRPTATGN
ncbi:MAG: carboxylate--amine ligase [Actinobacteria bacterium HGW-Actinobacteria-4]|nr:MAG: carboxylate--amine ligase [Actinobacteria bacterium HGW-Actinobacteria-4]